MAPCLPMPNPRALPESLGSGLDGSMPAPTNNGEGTNQGTVAVIRAPAKPSRRRDRREPFWPPRLLSTDVIMLLAAACCCLLLLLAAALLVASPARLSQSRHRRRRSSTSFLDRTAVVLVDVRRSFCRAPRAPSRPHRRAPTDVILTFSLVAALPIAAPAHSSQNDDSEPAPSREHVVL